MELLLRRYEECDARCVDMLKALAFCHEGWERAAKEEPEKTVLVLLNECLRDIAPDPTFLCTAARFGSLELIKALVHRGSDVNTKD